MKLMGSVVSNGTDIERLNEILTNAGCKFSQKGDVVYFDLQEQEENEGPRVLYDIPEGLGKIQFHIHAEEYGGCTPEGVIVVCGNNGNPLVLHRRSSRIPNSASGIFSARKSLNTVEAISNSFVTIFEHHVYWVAKTAYIDSHQIWAGPAVVAPAKFKKAVDAAIEKVQCEDCTHVHFVKQ